MFIKKSKKRKGNKTKKKRRAIPKKEIKIEGKSEKGKKKNH